MSDQRDETKRRPLLAHGERLSQKTTRSGMNGSKFHPFTPEQAWENLAPKAEALLRNVTALRPEVCGRHVIFEATLLPNYLASSYFPADLLDRSDLYIVGSRIAQERHITAKKIKDDEETKTLLLAGKPDRVANFAKMVSRRPTEATAKTWDRIRQFSDISLPKQEKIIVRRPELGAGEVITWEAVLTHIYDDPGVEAVWADEHFAKWVAHVKSLGGRVDVNYRRDLRNLTFVPVELSGEALEDAARFNLLRAIRPMPTLRPLPKESLRLFPGVTRPSRAANEGRIPSLTIAAFDGGVNPNLALFRPFVKNVDLTPEPVDNNAMKHGSVVTSALLYGPIVAGTELPDPEARIVHHRVLPVPKQTKSPDHGLYWILDQIVANVRREKFKLVSLSIGPNDPVEDDQEPTRWTTELDLLAREGVTFVAAVGNNGADDSSLGLNRILPPGDMVNGITVGACGTTNHEKFERAVYSAVGPGREGQRIAPTGLAFGGSDREPFVGIDPTGRLTNMCGTSFAAPYVARGIANLWNALDPSRQTPAHSRAFAIHFAKRHKRGHKFLELGHGLLPSAYSSTFECASNEVTVLYEDVLPRSEVIAMRFPFPTGLSNDLPISVEWTIAFTTDVDPRDPSDYALHGLDVIFRPNEAHRSMTGPDNDHIDVDTRVDAELIRAALADGYKLSLPVADSKWRPKTEVELRASGKWDTVIRGHAKLKSEELYEPRIDIQHLRRADGRLLNGQSVPPLRIAMLATIRAPLEVPLYDSVELAYPVLLPLIQLPVRISTVA